MVRAVFPVIKNERLIQRENKKNLVIIDQIFENTCFFSGVNENQYLITTSMFHDLLVNDFIHYLEPFQRFLLSHTDILLLQSNRPETVIEIIQAL